MGTHVSALQRQPAGRNLGALVLQEEPEPNPVACLGLNLWGTADWCAVSQMNQDE